MRYSFFIILGVGVVPLANTKVEKMNSPLTISAEDCKEVAPEIAKHVKEFIYSRIGPDNMYYKVDGVLDTTKLKADFNFLTVDLSRIPPTASNKNVVLVYANGDFTNLVVFRVTNTNLMPVWQDSIAYNPIFLGWVEVGDINKDGKLEILVKEVGGAGTMTLLNIFRWEKDHAVLLTPIGAAPQGKEVDLIDLDGDGLLDIKAVDVDYSHPGISFEKVFKWQAGSFRKVEEDTIVTKEN